MAELLRRSSNFYFTQFQGLKFVELAELRKKLRPAACRYQVVRNSVLGHALKDAGITGASDDLLQGPVGLVTGPGADPIAAAKALASFAKEFPKLQFRSGYIDGAWVSAADCLRLSALGTRPELLGLLVGALYSALAQVAGVAQAPMRDLALVLKALQEKKGSEATAA